MSTSASSVSGAPGATQRRGGDRSSRGTKIGGTRLHVTRRGDREYRAGREYVRLNTNSTRIVSKAPAATCGRDSDSTATRRPSRGGVRRPFRPPLSPPPPRFSPLSPTSTLRRAISLALRYRANRRPRALPYEYDPPSPFSPHAADSLLPSRTSSAFALAAAARSFALAALSLL